MLTHHPLKTEEEAISGMKEHGDYSGQLMPKEDSITNSYSMKQPEIWSTKKFILTLFPILKSLLQRRLFILTPTTPSTATPQSQWPSSTELPILRKPIWPPCGFYSDSLSALWPFLFGLMQGRFPWSVMDQGPLSLTTSPEL
jgi:hypothetical protein